MKRKRFPVRHSAWTLLCLTLSLLAACSPEEAPLLEGTGDHHFSISSDSEMAQRYFDQGLTLAYGFNHREAERSFREALRQDPDCAICYWGVALVLGPNYNMSMPEEHVQPAWEAVTTALNIGHFANEKEQDMINALTSRYGSPGKPGLSGNERGALDEAYARAMERLTEKYPDDADILTLYAEARMVLSPWQLYDEDGRPREHTVEAVAALEEAMSLNPRHPGALHYYIHALEPSDEPHRALTAAQTLESLVPVSGHLVHMPSHIYLRMGRYHDAVLTNQAASAADEDYVTQCQVQGFSADPYYPHNLHFLWYAAMMGGERELAIDTAGEMFQHSDRPRYAILPALTRLRFGQWEEALAEANKAEGNVVDFVLNRFRKRLNESNRPAFHFVRAVAHARLGNSDIAATEKAAMEEAIAAQGDSGPLPEIYRNVLDGILAETRGDTEARIAALQRAVEIQDQLPYREPPAFFYPVRESLGKAYLDAGMKAEAEAVFREDLSRNPRSGWSTLGLQLATKGQSNLFQAGFLTRQLRERWQHASFELPAPSYL